MPIDGQPKSIVQELENMARDYVKHENVIILAVTPANADLATSDALRLAREVDPTGERTIGALGKSLGAAWLAGGPGIPKLVQKVPATKHINVWVVSSLPRRT